MAINFYSLEKSELDLKENFLEFFKMCQRMYVKAEAQITAVEISAETVEDFLSYKIRANEKKRDIKDDCIWIISKDQPRASHLRFIIAVLYSVRDLERIVEQIYNILFYTKKFDLTLQLRKVLTEIFDITNIIFEKMHEVLKSQNVEKYEQEINELIKTFKEKYKNVSKKLLESFFNEIQIKSETAFNFSIIMKYMDRIMDHIYAIFDNFLMIKNV